MVKYGCALGLCVHIKKIGKCLHMREGGLDGGTPTHKGDSIALTSTSWYSVLYVLKIFLQIDCFPLWREEFQCCVLPSGRMGTFTFRKRS